MTFAERFQVIRTGFERPFWVANISEIFERLSYYAVFAVLARYLHEALQFPSDQAASLSGFFGAGVWVMAIFGGAIADRIGFRRALSLAYFILSCSYFMVGSIAAPWLASVRAVVPLGLMVGFILFLPALGVALVKPSVVGTTARASKENVRSIGYSIYYTLVNIGSFMGPFLAGWIHSRMRVENVFRLAALSVFLMFIGVLIFFREPRRVEEQQTTSIGASGAQSSNGARQRAIRSVPPDLFGLLDCLLAAVSDSAHLHPRLRGPKRQHGIDPDRRSNHRDHAHGGGERAHPADFVLPRDNARNPDYGLGMAGRRLASTGVDGRGCTDDCRAWGNHPVAALLRIHLARWRHPGQQGTYMGFAFLPIGIGSLIGGRFGGFLVHHFGEIQHRPERIWWAVTGVGVATAGLLWVYDRLIIRQTNPPAAA